MSRRRKHTSSITPVLGRSLREEFDKMLGRMQTKKSRAAMKAAFSASPEELGRAAVAAARKRG